MKTKFLALVIVCAGFLQVTGYADPFGEMRQQSFDTSANRDGNDGRHAEQTGEEGKPRHATLADDESVNSHQIFERNRTRNRIGLLRTNRPTQVPKTETPTIGNGENVPHTRAIQTRGFGREDELHSDTLRNSALPTRSPDVYSRERSFGGQRHPGPNPAVIDGAANSKPRNIQIDGSRISRKR